MTYLQLVNKVLLKLRETTVSDLSGNYAQLIGDLVNEAKKHVENAWPWETIRYTVTFSTVAGQETYDLTATTGTGGAVTSSTVTNERSYLKADKQDKRPLVFCTTNGSRLTEKGLDYIRTHRATRLTPTRVAPTNFAARKSATGMFIELDEPADAVYAMSAEIIIPQSDLSAVGDVLLVPTTPVVLYAAAFALRERGTGLGTDRDDMMAQADLALQESMDAEMEGDEMDLQLP